MASAKVVHNAYSYPHDYFKELYRVQRDKSNSKTYDLYMQGSKFNFQHCMAFEVLLGLALVT